MVMCHALSCVKEIHQHDKARGRYHVNDRSRF